MSSSRLETFRAMAAKDPTNALAQYGLANELVKAGEFAEARDVLESYLRAHDDEGAAYRLLALASEKLGDAEGAKEAYRRGIDSAGRHGHASMVSEYEMKLDDLE